MWNVTSSVGGSVVSIYTRASSPLLAWIGAGTMGEGGRRGGGNVGEVQEGPVDLEGRDREKCAAY